MSAPVTRGMGVPASRVTPGIVPFASGLLPVILTLTRVSRPPASETLLPGPPAARTRRRAPPEYPPGAAGQP